MSAATATRAVPHQQRRVRARSLLLSTSATGLIALSTPAVAGPDPCTLVNATRTCTGDQSGGISETTVPRLNVRDLTTDITPPSGPGIRLYRPRAAVWLNSNTGAYAIVTNGDFAPGITAGSYYGNATIVHSGDISTAGNGSVGITGFSANYYGFATVSVTVNGGHIQTSGSNSGGIRASSGRYSVASISNRADVTTSGNSSVALFSSSGNSAFVSNSGAIVTSGDNSSGIGAGSNYEAVGIGNSGNILTTGAGSAGIGGAAYNSVGINHSGDIETFGARARGITASAVLYSANITATGAVTTHGENAPAISASSQYGGAGVTATGAITTTGANSGAVSATSQYGNASVTATAAISTSGDNSRGIWVAAGYYGPAAVTLQGALSTGGSGSKGIVASSYNGSLPIVVSGDGSITTSGDGATAIETRMDGWSYSEARFDIGGDVSTAGNGSHGISASSYNDTARLKLTGRIATSGNLAHGFTVNADYGALIATVDGEIATSGQGSRGISFDARYFSGGTVEVAGGAAIRTSGDGAAAIWSHQGYGGFRVTNGGDIATSGAASHAIEMDLPGEPYSYPGRFVLTNSGSITATGLDASAVRLFLADGSDIANSGTIASGSGAAIFSRGPGDLQLSNTGVVSSNSGFALDLGARRDVVDQRGTISGNIRMGEGRNRLFNRRMGTVVASDILDTGTLGLLRNAGTFYVAGQDSVGVTAFTGLYRQLAAGTTVIDLDLAARTADLLEINGLADLAGTISLNVLTAPTVRTSRRFEPIPLITTTGGLLDNGVTLDLTRLELPGNFAYSFALGSDSNSLWLEVAAERPQTECRNRGPADPGRGGADAPPDRSCRPETLGRLADTEGSAARGTELSATVVPIRLVYAPEFAPTGVALAHSAESSLRWALDQAPCDPGALAMCSFVENGLTEDRRTMDATGRRFSSSGTRMAAGTAFRLGDDWLLATLVAGSREDISASWLSGGDSNSLAGSVRIQGSLIPNLNTSLTLAYQDYRADVTRVVVSGPRPAALASSQRIASHQLEAAAGYPIALGQATFTPRIAGSYTCHAASSYDEWGEGFGALSVDAWKSCELAVTPQLDLHLPLAGESAWLALQGRAQLIEGGPLTFEYGSLGSASTYATVYAFDTRFQELAAEFGGRIGQNFSASLTGAYRRTELYESWDLGISLRLAL